MTSPLLGSTEHLIQLTRQALDSFDEVGAGISTRRALRIARLRGDALHAWMFAHDLRPTGGSTEVTRSEATLLWPEEEYAVVHARHSQLLEEWIAERQPRVPEVLKDALPADALLSGSVEDIEARIASFTAARDREADTKARAVLDARLMMEAEVLGRIQYRVYSYLCQCERALGFGAGAGSIFDRYRTRVDSHLADLAPEVLEQLNAAYRRTQEGDSEARSHALTSCRRMLRSVADVVFPPRDDPIIGRDGKPHAAGADQYLARLWAFLDTQTGPGGAGRRLTTAALDDVGNPVERLNDLANKGVHAEVTQAEVDLCVLHSFLLAGEVLHLHSLASEG